MNQLFVLLLLLLTAVWDVRTRRIPNYLVLAGGCCGILYRIGISGISGIYISMIHILISGLVLFFFYQMSVIGAGDLKMISIISCFFSWKEWLVWLLGSVFFAGLFGIFYLGRGEKCMPFGLPMLLGLGALNLFYWGVL